MVGVWVCASCCGPVVFLPSFIPSDTAQRSSAAMARVSWVGRARCLLVVVVVVMMRTKPAFSQDFPTVAKSIANPDFPCGEPYGPNGEPPAGRRVARQIIFPDEEIYHHYWAQLMHRGEPGVRGGEAPLKPVDETDTFCGASVISDRFLITAAHCIYEAPNPVNSVRLGDINLRTDRESNSKPVDHEITLIITHPGYDPEKSMRHNDLALLMTKEKIQFNDIVFPYCISDQPPAPGTLVTIAGFGLFNATTKPDHLLEANFTVMDTAECEKIYQEHDQEAFLRVRYPNLLQGTDIICATDDTSDACQGDSGGPMFMVKDGKRYLEGVVSGGASCRANFKSVLPGLYISLARHVHFISDYVLGPPVDVS
ncbi:CLIP domain-containing serine protease B4-like isoform X1 [Scylla paramamosain]|uniref:CLIP domain-containing serine protease B4-like isoform X1 n=2 Tax=Scylla paramamosain TaxID=85552 RepID=UPI003083BCC1